MRKVPLPESSNKSEDEEAKFGSYKQNIDLNSEADSDEQSPPAEPITISGLPPAGDQVHANTGEADG